MSSPTTLRRSLAEADLYSDPDYVPPKKPYSFLAMLDDILVFATDTLVDNGRLAFWMPTANDENQEIATPTHPCLEVVDICVQPFYKCELCHTHESGLKG